MIKELILSRLFFSLLLLLSSSPFCTYKLTFQMHPKDEFFESQINNIPGVFVGFHPDCDGSDWAKIPVPPALNSGLASLLLGL